MINTAKPPEIPDALAHEALRANWLYPQMTGGITALAGARAIEMCLWEELDILTLAHSIASEEQLTRLASSVIKAHEMYNIPSKYQGDLTKKVPYRFGPTQIRTVAEETWLPRSLLVMANYTAEMIPSARRSKVQLDSDLVVNDAAKLFEPQGTSRRFHPEAEALGALWQVISHTTLKHPDSRKLAKAHRQGLNDLGKARAHPVDIVAHSSTTMNALLKIVNEQVEDALPAIRQSTGVEVSVGHAVNIASGIILGPQVGA